MSSQKFVVSHMDQQMGPWDEQELKSRWAKGEILPIDYLYDEQKADWITLAERFAWARADEVSPPPPVRTEGITIRKATAALTNPNAPKPAGPAKPASVTPPPSPKMQDGPVRGDTAKIDIGNLMAAAVGASEPVKPVAPAPAAPAPVTAKASTMTAVSAPPPQITLRSEPVLQLDDTDVIHRDTEPMVKLETIPPGPAPARPPQNEQDTRVKLVNGMGEIDLAPLNPGRVQLIVQDPESPLKLQEPMKIQVRPAEPVEVVWQIAEHHVVGNDLEIVIKALDENGNICLHYTDQFVVQIRGPSPRDLSVTTQDGQVHLRLKHTKAEMWKFSLHYSGEKNLKLPESRQLEWQPGPAARLVLDGPHEYIAGRPVKVQVKAVDAYGNVAKHFSGEVNLEVKAS